MQAKQYLVAIVILCSAAVLFWPQDDNTPVVPAVENHTASSSKKTLALPEINSFATPSANSSESPTVVAASSSTGDEIWDETAIEQMRTARLHGDERAPPIQRDPVAAEMPTQAELDYPEFYNQYETRQEIKLKTAYLAAAYPQMARLEQQLQAMRKAGLDPAALREGEEKLIQLQAMTRGLQEQHPELVPNPQLQKPSTQVPVDQTATSP